MEIRKDTKQNRERKLKKSEGKNLYKICKKKKR